MEKTVFVFVIFALMFCVANESVAIPIDVRKVVSSLEEELQICYKVIEPIFVREGFPGKSRFSNLKEELNSVAKIANEFGASTSETIINISGSTRYMVVKLVVQRDADLPKDYLCGSDK